MVRPGDENDPWRQPSSGEPPSGEPASGQPAPDAGEQESAQPWGPPPEQQAWGAPPQQQPWGQPPNQGWGAPPGQAPAWGDATGRPPYGSPYGTSSSRNGAGIAALILGLLSLPAAVTVIGGILFGVLAIALGIVGRRRVARGEATNRGAATSGIALGVLGLLAGAVIGAAVFVVLDSVNGRDFLECIERTAGDPTAVDQCERELRDELIR